MGYWRLNSTSVHSLKISSLYITVWGDLKDQSTILIPYSIFSQIQRIAPQSPIAVGVQKHYGVLTKSWLRNCEKRQWLGPSHKLSQPIDTCAADARKGGK